MQNYIDLHMHTNASDGTDSFDEIVQKAKDAGLKFFAITDHDTVESAIRASALDFADAVFLRGIELSSKAPSGFKCHILGYGCDFEHERFRHALDVGKKKRRAKLDARLDFLQNECAVEFSKDELDSLYSIPSAGKPHIANILVAKGLASDKEDAIERYINRAKTKSSRIDAALSIDAINSSSGISVWAHPLGGEGEMRLSEDEFASRLKELMELGIGALECYYSRYSAAEEDMLLEYARKNSLLVSAGSDYHGKNKDVRIGDLGAGGRVVEREDVTLLNLIG